MGHPCKKCHQPDTKKYVHIQCTLIQAHIILEVSHYCYKSNKELLKMVRADCKANSYKNQPKCGHQTGGQH